MKNRTLLTPLGLDLKTSAPSCAKRTKTRRDTVSSCGGEADLMASRRQENHRPSAEEGTSTPPLHVTDGRIGLRGRKCPSHVSQLSACGSLHFDTCHKAPKPAWGHQHKAFMHRCVAGGSFQVGEHMCGCPPGTRDLIPPSLITCLSDVFCPTAGRMELSSQSQRAS